MKTLSRLAAVAAASAGALTLVAGPASALSGTITGGTWEYQEAYDRFCVKATHDGVVVSARLEVAYGVGPDASVSDSTSSLGATCTTALSQAREDSRYKATLTSRMGTRTLETKVVYFNV